MSKKKKAKNQPPKDKQKDILLSRLDMQNEEIKSAIEVMTDAYAMNVFLMNVLIKDLK